MNPPGSIDRLVVGRGAAFGLLLGAPAAVANVLLADQDPKPKAALNATLLALLVAFWLSGFVAGREATDRRAVHGAHVSTTQIVVLAVVAVAVATGGAGLGARRPTTPPPEPGGSP